MSVCVLCSCTGVLSKNLGYAKLNLLFYVSDEPYIINMSKNETNRLYQLLCKEKGWTEVEPCNCTSGYELTLNETCYRICNTHATDHPIRYGEENGGLNKAMTNQNSDIVSEINSIIRSRGNMGTSYECFMSENQKKSENAMVRYLNGDNTNSVMISEKDTNRLRVLLSMNSGWEQYYGCQCIGETELILDNILYIIDLTDLNHQIKYGLPDSDLLHGFKNENKEVVQEIYDIVGTYLD